MLFPENEALSMAWQSSEFPQALGERRDLGDLPGHCCCNSERGLEIT